MGNKVKITTDDFAASCYFRSTVEPPHKKALLKITDRCNLHCAHCFVSAGKDGAVMPFDDIREKVIPRLVDMNVISTTLTGGEPFAHPDIMKIIHELRAKDLSVSLCTNGTLISETQIEELSELGGVKANVSLDGFRRESHGKFRGEPESFDKTVETVRTLAKHGILNGILVTPNRLADPNEYSEICEFAIANGAKYVLMNPLSSFGRGTKSQKSLESPDEVMKKVEENTRAYGDRVELVPIRFPNEKKPLSSCNAGNILYVFPNGDVSACAYLSFAAEEQVSQYSPKEFIIGNILTDDDVVSRVVNYSFKDYFKQGDNQKCKSCGLNSACGKGCPAAVIGTGQKITEVDTKQCPIKD